MRLVKMHVGEKIFLVQITPEEIRDDPNKRLDASLYEIARRKLGVTSGEITMWREVVFDDEGVCRIV